MAKPRIGIIIGTIREGRFGEKPAAWIHEIASARADLEAEIVDLRDYPLPLFDAPASPARIPPANAVAQRWGQKLAELDGYIFVTAEYNHGPSGVLKNAIDWVYPQLVRKPATFIGYGNAGGARAIEQLRLILIELQVAPLRNAVHVGLAEFVPMLMQGKGFADFPQLAEKAGLMLDELAWWAATLAAGRGTIAAAA
jgi:NAD(P)H-dependent FMN reductase